MGALLYVRLIVLTAATLLPFFWMIVILGHRRQRNFERVFFFLCLALTCFFGCSLLALNAQLFYEASPPGLIRFTWSVLCLGLWFLPTLVLHLHLEYANVRELVAENWVRRTILIAVWTPALILGPALIGALRLKDPSFDTPSHSLGIFFQAWLLAAVLISALWQTKFRKAAPDQEQQAFHRDLRNRFVFLFVCLLLLVLAERSRYGRANELFSLLVVFAAVEPLGALARNVQRFNFLQIGRQRNLIFAVFGVFLALLYLSLVRRISLLLEPYLPPEASAALLLFLPVVFFEPLQRWIRRLLRQAAQSEVERAQRLMGPINEVARLGNFGRLVSFSEKWIAEQLELADVGISMEGQQNAPPASSGQVRERFELRRANQHLGYLSVRPYGAMMSGETFAALEFLCEQLPAAFDFCRLIEEKLRLERELAERERLAALGQMAASISHNLKNPLGSIKTILQVQIESRDLPENFRAENKMVLDEINRLSAKLNQLLQFSRPAVLGQSKNTRCDAAEVLRDAVEILRPEADRRGIAIELRPEVPLQPSPSSNSPAISRESLNDILSNLLVNALDAASEGGRVRLQAAQSDGECVITVEDDGPGIPPDAREKILQPFFTTKSQGTGLGLAIVARRVAEAGGQLDWQSPIANARGARFHVRLPLAQ